MLDKISAFGSPFSHDISSCAAIPPTNFEWIFNQPCSSNIEVYMDYDILGGIKSQCPNKFLWLCESKELFLSNYEFIKNNLNIFKNYYKKIFVNDKNLLNIDSIFDYCPPASNKSWILNGEVYNKNKLVSMICSGIDITSGHKYRNKTMLEFKNKNLPIDFYGRNVNPFKTKKEPLADYCFSFVIENGSYSNYYTEKIMDCFACGTIPIYWGSPDIGNFFNLDGIIIFNENFDFNSLSYDLYFSKIKHIKENFLLEKNHKIADDFLYEKIQNYI